MAPARSYRFSIWVTLSALVHLALLVEVRPTIMLSGQDKQILSVTLAPQQTTSQPPVVAEQAAGARAATRMNQGDQAPARRADKRSAQQRPPSRQEAAVTDRSQAVQNVSPTDNDRSLSAGEVLKAQIRARLQSELTRYFDYPALARRHGWQGEVLLGFRVATDGRLDRIHVAHSSGYYVLDESALNSLGRVGRLSEASFSLRTGALEMQLPIIYRLRER